MKPEAQKLFDYALNLSRKERDEILENQMSNRPVSIHSVRGA